MLDPGRKENLTHVATVIRWPILPMSLNYPETDSQDAAIYVIDWTFKEKAREWSVVGNKNLRLG
jgi:hypothetical protein